MSSEKNHLIWLCFDLGVGGDYEGMYRWLDNRKAKECGDSCAVFSYPFKTDLLAELKKDIESSVSLDEKRHRVYVIYHEGTKTKGTFLLGPRRQAPWTGYGVLEEQTVDEA